MPTSKTTAPGVFSRRVAPFAPLGIALLMQSALLPGTGAGGAAANDAAAVKCPTEDMSTFEACHNQYPTGCSPSGRYDPYLNLLKNQLVAPTAAPVGYLKQPDFARLDQNTPKELGGTKNNHADFKDPLAKLGEGQIYGVVGYLYYEKPSGKESSNCELAAPDDIDFHIGIGFDAALAGRIGPRKKTTSDERRTAFIVEMTPHWRAKFKPDWDIDVLKPVIGRQVRVVGQLLVDSEHNNAKDNCAYPGASQTTCWRASVWELHPVTRLEVCAAGTCTESGGQWVDVAEFAAKEPAPAPPSSPPSP